MDADYKFLTRKKIGDMVRQARTSKGFSTRELAALTGLQQSHICRIEAGKYNVTIDTMATLGNALDKQIMFI